MKYYLRLTLSLLVSWLPLIASAQNEYSNWYFGERAGLTFLTNPISALPPGVPGLGRDVSCVSDSAGNLQFIAEGNVVWNRRFQVMSGGALGGAAPVGYVAYGYEVLAVPQPGRSGRYYIFTPQHWSFSTTATRVPTLPPNLGYYVVDMRQQGGMGAVVARDSAASLPGFSPVAGVPQGYVRSSITSVRHANGRDLWLVVKNDQHQYLSFLLDRQGLHPQPVVTPNTLGRLPYLTYSGLLKASADGRTIAYSQFSILNSSGAATTAYRFSYVEVGHFDALSGRVSNAYVIPDSVRYRLPPSQWQLGMGGLAFSPDGSRLYVDTIRSQSIWQYDLTAASPAAVAASRTIVTRPLTVVNSSAGFGNNLQLGPDGRLYHVGLRARVVSRFDKPNALGLNTAFRDSALLLSPGTSALAGLPNATCDLNLPPVVVTNAGSIAATGACAGEPVQFSSSLSPFVTAVAYAWNFGDPASGNLNTAIGQAPVHRFPAGGTFVVTLRVTAASGQVHVTTQSITIRPIPTVVLSAPRLVICPGQSTTLTAGPQPPGSAFRWQNGSTQASLVAQAAGTYTLVVTNAQGCSAQASVRVSLLPVSPAFLGQDTTVCLEQPYLLRPRQAQLLGTTYRWQDGSTASSISVASPGRYELQTTTADGCVDQAGITISNGNCPVVLPNIITPNGDNQNQTFVLEGLNAPDWSLRIFNRWGREIYRQEQYGNGWAAENEPDGVYYYQLINRLTNQRIKGWLEVRR